MILLPQYPGVAQSIDSDIDNLMGILKLWNILPEGGYYTCTFRWVVGGGEWMSECGWVGE